MNLSGMIDWLDDRINPIVVKELRQAVKSRIVVGILLLFLGLQLFMLGSFLLMRESRADTNTIDWSAGNEVFRWQQVILQWTIMLLVPAYAAIRLATERSDQNVDLMFISTLRPVSIVWGKFFAAFMLGALIFSACAPFMTFCYLLRGIDIPTILIVLFVDLLCMLFGIMLALFLASLPGARPIKFVITFLGFIALAYMCAGMSEVTYRLITMGDFFDFMLNDWPIFASMVAGSLAFDGLLFFYCVALISPPSANRILPLRIYLFFAWLVVCGVVWYASHRYTSPGMPPVPILLFLLTVCPFLGIQMWISISERERWAPRVARTIPQSPALRFLAFFFYTGSAGGVAYSLILFAISVGGAGWWLYANQVPGRMWENAFYFVRAMLLLAMYVYCYGMSAVLVRHYVLANQLKINFTWLVGLLLVGLGSSIPYTIAFIFFSDEMRTFRGELNWWSLPNPFAAGWDAFNIGNLLRDGQEVLYYWFAGTWTMLVTVLAMPWFVAQVRAFKPYVKRDHTLAEVVRVPETILVETTNEPITAQLPS